MNCPKCGSSNEDGAKLCYRCYAPLKTSQESSRGDFSIVKVNDKPRFGRLLIYISIIVVLGIISVFIVARTFIPKGKVYEGIHESISPELKKEAISITDTHDAMMKALKRKDPVALMKHYDKSFRDSFNKLDKTEQLFRVSFIFGGMLKTPSDYNETIRNVKLSEDLTNATVLIEQAYTDSDTNEKVAKTLSFPFVKEDNSWKLNITQFLKDNPEALKLRL